MWRVPDIWGYLCCASHQAGPWPQARISQDAAGENMYANAPNLACGCCILADPILAWKAALEGAVGNQPCVLSNPPPAGDLSSTTLDVGEMPDFTELGDFGAMGLNQLAWPLGISDEGDALSSSRHSLYDEKDILATLEASENNASDSWSALIQDAIQPGCNSRSAKNLMARRDATARANSGPQTPANTDESGSPACSPDMTIPSLVQADL